MKTFTTSSMIWCSDYYCYFTIVWFLLLSFKCLIIIIILYVFGYYHYLISFCFSIILQVYVYHYYLTNVWLSLLSSMCLVITIILHISVFIIIKQVSSYYYHLASVWLLVLGYHYYFTSVWLLLLFYYCLFFFIIIYKCLLLINILQVLGYHYLRSVCLSLSSVRKSRFLRNRTYIDLRPVCKFEFVRCGPVEKIQSTLSFLV